MHRLRYIDFPAATCAIAIAAMQTLCVPGALAQDRQVPDPSRQAASDANASRGESETRLNFLNKDWAFVLNQVADETGSVLVMPEVPPGKFTRTDFGRRPREEAVRILNRDLERVGYRVVIDNEKLNVISTRRKRPEYERPAVSEQRAAPSVQERFTASSPDGRKQPVTEPRRISQAIQQAAFEAEGAEEAAPESVTATIQPKNRKAVDVARQIHGAFKARARLEDAGPHGLPASVVEHFDPAAVKAKRPLFVMEIDTDGNQLLITGENSVVLGIRQLIDRVDLNPLAVDRMPALVAGNGDIAETGRKLAEPLSLIAQLRQDQAPAGSAETPAAEPVPETREDLPALLGRLKGDVTIQSLDDLDLLIIEGNEKDVEAVRQVIAAIERLAIGSLPEIHLLRLRHVDSQSLSQLLNDVYERMSELRTNNAQQSQAAVRVVPVVSPNAVLVLAPSNAMQAILDLADELDQPIDPTHEVQIFRLKHAVASSVVEVLQEFYDDEPVGLGTRLKASADDRTNSVIVQAMPRDLSEIAEVIKGMDSEQASATSQVKVIQLKSATADELSQFLNNAIQGVLNPPPTPTTGQGQGGFGQMQGGGTQNQAVRSVVLEFLAEGGRQLIRSGLLNDIRFTPEARTNSLMVTAPAQSMPLIEELITLLDRPSDAQAEIKVYGPLKNADAAAAVELLEGIFAQNQNQNQGQGFGQTGQTGALGIEIAGAAGSSSNLIPLRFYPDTRTNTVVAIGGAGTLKIVEAIIFRLDSNNAQSRKMTTVKLRNISAEAAALAINEFLAAQRELATIDADRISTSQLLEQEIIVSPEPVSNNLIISATPAYLAQLMELVKELDMAPPQVIIQAMLVEVELDNTDEFGMELGFQDPVLFDRSVLEGIQTITQTISDPGQPQVTNTQVISSTATPGFNFNNQPLGGNNGVNSRPARVGTQGLSNFAVGRVNDELGFGGLVLSASSESVSVLIRALAARRTLRVLSRPQIMAVDNQIAQIQVGQVVPVVNGATITNNIVNPTIERDNAGIILTVTPRISPEGQVIMEVAAEKSDYSGAGVPVFTDAATGNVITSPIKNITTARTTVKVPDGQTIVVGGMITKNDQSVERKVPWLGDLPLIGNVFRYDLHEHRRTELLVFLTPRVVHNDADAEMIKSVEAGRLHFFQDDVESLHGPIFGVPPEMMLPGELLPPTEIIYPQDAQPTLPANPYPIPPAPSGKLISPDIESASHSSVSRSPVVRLGEVPAK